MDCSNVFFKITVYSCLEITLQVSEIVDKVLCWVLFFALVILFRWKEFSVAIRFFGHPFEVVARIFLSTQKNKRPLLMVSFLTLRITDGNP